MRASSGIAPVLLGLLACGSGANFVDAGAFDSGPSIATLADDFASADCSRRFACMPYAVETRAFGDDVADCAQAETGYQTRSLMALGTSTDYSNILECITQMKAATCQQYLDSTFGMDPTAMPACSKLTPGTLEDGAGCAYGRQCKSNLCASLPGQCGKCAPLVATAGAGCDPITNVCDLSKGLLCNPTSMSCAVPKGRGEGCTVDSDCYLNLLCSPTTMTCDDFPDTVGAACNPSGDGCSFRIGAGLVCNKMSMMCEIPAQNGLGGASCGYMQPSGGMLLCGVGYLCDGSKDGFSGKCIPGHAAAPGGECTFKGLPPNGPDCEAEGLCIGGVCKVDDPTTCH